MTDNHYVCSSAPRHTAEEEEKRFIDTKPTTSTPSSDLAPPALSQARRHRITHSPYYGTSALKMGTAQGIPGLW